MKGSIKRILFEKGREGKMSISIFLCLSSRKLSFHCSLITFINQDRKILAWEFKMLRFIKQFLFFFQFPFYWIERINAFRYVFWMEKFAFCHFMWFSMPMQWFWKRNFNKKGEIENHKKFMQTHIWNGWKRKKKDFAV